jgi:hypothetical protein
MKLPDKKIILAIISSFVIYIILNNIFFSIVKLFTGNFIFNTSIFFLKGNICFTRNPENASGFLFFLFLILKFTPAAILFYSSFSKKAFIKPILICIIVNFYLFDIYALISFLLQKDYSSATWLYGFCSAPLFISSYVFFSNYLIIPIASSLLGLFLLFSFASKVSIKYTYYLLFSILGAVATIIGLEILIQYFLQ